MKKNSWGFDTRDMDTKVRPQDDFYHYAAGGWLKKNPIPAHESRWGSFLVLRHNTDTELRALLTKIEKVKQAKVGSAEQMIRDLYRSYLNTKARNAAGLDPLKPWLTRIEKVTDVASLVAVLAHLEKIGAGGPWGLIIEQDMKNSAKYILHICQSGLGMPDRDYYLNNDPESVRVRTAYEKHIEAMSLLAGDSKTVATQTRVAIMRIETALAELSMRKEDLRDPDKTYHKKSLAALNKLTKHIDWRAYFKIAGVTGMRDVIVMQPDFLRGVATLLTSEPIDDWKAYLKWHLIAGASSIVSEKFEKQNFNFYGRTLSGVKIMRPPWRRALGIVNGTVGELLGKLYVETYFGSEAKKRVRDIVADLFEAYEARIKNLDWMSHATKKKALAKLRAITKKLGYPDTWRSYKGLVVRPDDLFGNMVRATAREHARVLRKLTKTVDRKEWFMYPQTINAYYSPNLNDIVFPAAILQPPFFDKDADDAINYGAIGSVIGHEITHGFDDQGCKFDGKGNRKTWWTKQDTARFEKKAQVLVQQYNKYTVADGLKVNGQLTLGENIADLGGASIAYDAYQLRLKKTGRKNIEGFTPEQRFFLGLAVIERENRRPEAEKVQVLTDPHSPSITRVNGPVSNLPEFYEAFGVKKGNKLYREPKNRAKIW